MAKRILKSASDTNTGVIEMAGSSLDIRLQIAGLVDGTTNLEQFQRWFASAALTIELHGSDADVDLSNRVMNLLAEYTGDHISAPELMRALIEAAELPTPTATVTSAA